VVERKILNLAVPPVETRFEVLPEVGGEARSTIFFAEWRTVSSKPGADLLGNRRFESISLQRWVHCELAPTVAAVEAPRECPLVPFWVKDIKSQLLERQRQGRGDRRPLGASFLAAPG
jgi:hypothetical protein